jgi:catechol 2,3-dioxygenase-like lactoylglutathione lyase family enzyme
MKFGMSLLASFCILALPFMSISLTIGRILETSIYAEDLARAELFYEKVLGLKLFAKEKGRHVFFRCGDQMLLVFNPAKTLREVQVPHGTHGPGHVAFAVPLDKLEPWISRLKEHGIKVEKDMSWPGGGRSIYFRDPAGNCLELASPLVWRMPDEGLPTA